MLFISKFQWNSSQKFNIVAFLVAQQSREGHADNSGVLYYKRSTLFLVTFAKYDSALNIRWDSRQPVLGYRMLINRNGISASRPYWGANNRIGHLRRTQALYKFNEAIITWWRTPHMTTHFMFDELIGIVFEIDILGIMHSSLVSQPVCRANNSVVRSQKAQASNKINNALNIWWRTLHMTTHWKFGELVGIVLEIRVCCTSHTIVHVLGIMHSS